MRSSPIAAAALAVVLIAGCGGSGTSSSSTGTSTEKQPTSNAQIDFRVTGGIAGVNQELVIDPDGRGSVTTGYRQSASTQHFRLSEAELADLRDKIVAADIGHLPQQPPSGCADCFEYSIKYAGLSYAADQISIPKPLEPAIAALTKLIAQHTSGSGPSISGK